MDERKFKVKEKHIRFLFLFLRLMQYHFSPAMDSLQSSAIREILKNTADPAVIPFAA